MSLEAVLLIILIILILCFGVGLYLAIKKQGGEHYCDGVSKELSQIENRLNMLDSANSALRQELSSIVQISVKNMGDILSQSQSERLVQLENRLKTFSLESEQKLENIRASMEVRLTDIKNENARSLEQMRKTVDENLQKTLEEKMSRSFALVNERLEQVYKGLGEMQSLANGVGDLKKVLSNVKTRGIIGELQLGAILKEVLSPEQYEENAITKKGSKNYVEFAVKLPQDSGEFIYLPIDSKFPGDTYSALCDAYDSGDKLRIDEARKRLHATLKSEAKDISDKYLDPPNTTDFAIMFLPFEGLYAEAVNSGIVEQLQRSYKVNIAGPSTMAALLNSLQMGFKTLAVQKQSTEVWRVLGSVKSEFDKFNDILVLTQQRIEQANAELDKLVGVRTRQIRKRLSQLDEIDIPKFSDKAENNQ
ncbi:MULTISPECIES: DNA recombination protein RmuC [unclassified Ruminococcus]|uniref:DNA recombination protein RmuC n=1 Tax=unclassified Ruminococcus TaxID=2608920 RepID=UPI00210CC0C7|nr:MULTISPECIES: DNA recombination protein RmuC [unclassified Ruminococcus]MCQ4022458.1 DNA recombination protein RmuC [Ruminococcus sp. zg-924]MCQ4115722.1 DNA recombination protein RmuC [Ruminococcus sp. zg-921]